MSATTNDSDTPTTEDQKKRPRSPPDHSDILEALAELQYHLDDLPDDVVNEEMQLQLARLSAKLHRSPRREVCKSDAPYTSTDKEAPPAHRNSGPFPARVIRP